MFAGAAFTDQADITQTEAVDMLVALGVINGNPDGSFKPNGTVTRAEMAKMIYVVRNQGNDNADSWKSGSTAFNDVNGHWAVGYIKFCEAQKIIAGKSATVFDPDALVTGTEAAKMLLVCAGYQADKAGLTGTGWDQKSLALASESGMLDDMGATNFSAGLPRQYAAQIIYNALYADTVTWSADTSSFEKKETTVSKIVNAAKPNEDPQYVATTVTENETVGQKWMKLTTVESDDDSNILTSVKKEDNRDTFTIEAGGQTYTRVEKDFSALLGQDVKILIKNNDKSKVYGVSAGENTKVMTTVTANQLKIVTDTAKIKANDIEYKLDGVLKSGDGGMVANEANTSVKTNLHGMIGVSTYAPYAIKLIDNNGNGKIDNVVSTPAKVGEVTYVGSSSITVKNVGTIKRDDASIYDGVKKNDWAIVVDADNTSDDKDVVTKAEVISGKVTGKKTNSVKVDGTWYDVVSGVKADTGSSYDFVLVGGMIYNASETESASKDILFLSSKDTAVDTDSFDTNEGTLEAKVYLTDGTDKKIKIEKFEGKKLATEQDSDDESKYALVADVKDNTLYTYSTNKDGNYEIKELTSDNDAGYDAITTLAGTFYAKQKIGGKSIADDAVVFVKYDTTVKILSGKQVKNWSDTAYGTAGVIATDTTNGISYVKVAYLSGNEAYDTADKDYMFGYLTLDPYESEDADGDATIAYEIWDGSENKVVMTEGTSKVTGISAGDAIMYKVDGNYVTDVAEFTITAAITGFDYKAEGTLVYSTTASKDVEVSLDEDCVFIAINSADEVGVEGGMEQIQEAQPDEKNAEKLVPNAYLFVNGAGNVQAIVYDLEDNALDGVASISITE